MAVTVFTLTGMLASCGTLAGNERRPTEARPGASMLAGLLACAYGLGRDENWPDWRFAVATHVWGAHLRDYHTMAAPQTHRSTRGLSLRAGKIVTTQTWRDYLVTPWWTVAAMGDHIEALSRPVWPLYLGRKACPLGAHPDPQLFNTEDLVEALRLYGARGETAIDARHAGEWPVARIETRRVRVGGGLMEEAVLCG